MLNRTCEVKLAGLDADEQALLEEVIGTDPWRARITLPSEGRECEVTLDEHLDVVDIERPDR